MKYFKGIKTALTRILLLEDMQYDPDELHLQYSTDEESDKGDYVEWLIFKNIK